MPDAFSFFFACPRSFNLTFLKQIENKQTNLYKSVFDVFERSAILVPKKQQQFFFCPGMSKDIQTEMCVHPHIFHLKEAQRSQAWFK